MQQGLAGPGNCWSAEAVHHINSPHSPGICNGPVGQVVLDQQPPPLPQLAAEHAGEEVLLTQLPVGRRPP